MNGVTHYYYYDGINLVKEEWGDNILVFFYDANGSPVGMQYRDLSDTDGDWETYLYEKNLQGDIMAVYDTSSTRLVSYTYDAWGRIQSTYCSNGGANTSAVHNPFRYRGYYYDDDLDLYYLATRYYDPEVRRFVTMDDYSVLTATPMGLTDKNLFAYCDNNPITRVDNGGAFWDIIWDVISIGFGVADVIENPDDGWAWAGLAADVVDLVPFVSCLGESVRAVRAADKIIDVVDTTHDIAKTTNGVEGFVDSIKYTDKVLKQMDNAGDLNHAFPTIIDTFVDVTAGRPIKGGDGVMRNIIEIPGSINNTPGIFEYIIEPNGMCNHRYFRKLGK